VLDAKVGTITPACILTAKRNFLVAVGGGGIGSPSSGPGATALRTDATSPNQWEVFTLIPKDTTHAALQTADGRHYVTAVKGGGMGPSPTGSLPLPIVTNGQFSEPETVFHIVLLARDKQKGFAKVRLVTPDVKHYVVAANGGGVNSRGDPMRTDATKPGIDELFEMIFFNLLSRTVHGPPNT